MCIREKHLKKQINGLFKLSDYKEISNKIRNICVYFLHNFGIKAGNKKIIPLRVEAYYHTSDNKTFAQKSEKGRPIVHCDETQLKWSVLHFYHCYGYNAVDICLSTGNNYFSLLLKSAFINDNIKIQPSKIADELNKKYKNGSKVKLFSNYDKKTEPTFSTPRTGITLSYEYPQEENNPLGVLIRIDICKKYGLTQKKTKQIWP